MKKAIILLNMGGADDLSQVEMFLKNMFNDPYILTIKNSKIRSILAWLITKMRLKSATSNYVVLGGKSPIGDITRSLVAKLNQKIKVGEIKFDYAMNYTPPFANDTLKKYINFDEIVLFPLYPQHSSTTITSSLDGAKKAISDLGIKANIKIVDYFYKDENYNDIIVNNIKNKTLNQSRLGPVEWLGPNLNEVLPKLESKKALIYPISFCIDNSETDFELSIEYRHVANENRFEYYEVVKAPNDSDEFVNFIAKKVSLI